MADDIDDKEISEAKSELEAMLQPRYSVGNHLGQGGAGIVFEITDTASAVKRVAKVLRPTVLREFTPSQVRDIKGEFRSEARKLAQLRHENLVTVFEQSHSDPPYFVMEFVDGSPLDKGVANIAQKKKNGRWISDFRRIYLRLADVLAYLHSQKPIPLLHLDLKPENIILTSDYRDKPVPILLDFGISRFVDNKPGEISVKGTFPMWPRAYFVSLKRMTTPERTLFVIDRKKVNKDLDLHLLGRTISLALDAGVKKDPKTSSWDPVSVSELSFLRETLNQLDIDKPEFLKFDSAAELRKALRRLDLRASRTAGYFGGGSVRIPGRSIRSYGETARRLTDWPSFQRLHGIHQLGLTYLVYPGATHSRLEHSLGVFQNAIEVLDYLSGPSGDFRFRSMVSDEEMAATAIVALLHDIGHYPFAHQFRVEGEFPDHDERTLLLMKDDFLRKSITRWFGGDIYKTVVALMKYIIDHERPGPQVIGSHDPDHFRVLRAIISSSIDVDKLDYVARDALHCGVPYGSIVDHERFVTSLRIWWDKGGLPHLLLSDKGRACAEALVFARYLMTSEVYWNHAVRSYAATLSAAIGQLSKDEVSDHLWDNDDAFLAWLGGKPKTKWLVKLIEDRRPFRRAFVHQKLGGGVAGDDTDERLFNFLEDAAKGEKKVLHSIRQVVAGSLKIANYKEHEIVLDVPAGMTRLSGVQVLAEGHEEPGPVGPIFDAIGVNFDGFARKARIFVRPDLLKGRSVAESTSIVRKALLQEFRLT